MRDPPGGAQCARFREMTAGTDWAQILTSGNEAPPIMRIAELTEKYRGPRCPPRVAAISVAIINEIRIVLMTSVHWFHCCRLAFAWDQNTEYCTIIYEFVTIRHASFRFTRRATGEFVAQIFEPRLSLIYYNSTIRISAFDESCDTPGIAIPLG